MKIAVVSDFHLGFDFKGERKNDAFLQAKEAMEKIVSEKADLILIAGDLFDESIPKPEAFFEALQLLSIAKKSEKSKVNISIDGNFLHFFGIPVIAIHGTHEFRGKEFKNPLELLEQAEFLIYLHAKKIFVEKEKEKICIQGLGGVPEKMALNVLKEFNPKPEKCDKNFLLLHQSFKEFLATDDPMNVSLSLEDLPQGFDFIINGHLHWSNELKLGKTIFLIPGSTIITQMKKLEAEKPKGFYLIDTEANNLKFIELKSQRKLFYYKIQFKEASKEEIIEKLKELTQKSLKENNKLINPLIRFKLEGTLKKGLTQTDIEFNDFLKEFNGKAIFSIEKNFFSDSFKKKISDLRELQKSKQSIARIGLELLEKNLHETDFKEAFNVRQIFALLQEDRIDEAMELLTELKFEALPEKKSEKEKQKLAYFFRK